MVWGRGCGQSRIRVRGRPALEVGQEPKPTVRRSQDFRPPPRNNHRGRRTSRRGEPRSRKTAEPGTRPSGSKYLARIRRWGRVARRRGMIKPGPRPPGSEGEAMSSAAAGRLRGEEDLAPRRTMVAQDRRSGTVSAPGRGGPPLRRTAEPCPRPPCSGGGAVLPAAARQSQGEEDLAMRRTTVAQDRGAGAAEDQGHAVPWNRVRG